MKGGNYIYVYIFVLSFILFFFFIFMVQYRAPTWWYNLKASSASQNFHKVAPKAQAVPARDDNLRQS